MFGRLFVGFVVGLGFVGFSGGDVFAASSGVDEEIVVEEKREGSSDDALPPEERDRSGAPVLKPKTGGGGAGSSETSTSSSSSTKDDSQTEEEREIKRKEEEEEKYIKGYIKEYYPECVNIVEFVDILDDEAAAAEAKYQEAASAYYELLNAPSPATGLGRRVHHKKLEEAGAERNSASTKASEAQLALEGALERMWSCMDEVNVRYEAQGKTIPTIEEYLADQGVTPTF